MTSDKQSSVLFTPLQVGDIEVPNRIWMAPLTRCRSGADRIPNDMMAEYYVQRAAAGLILTEATVVSPMGIGYADTPGIYNDEQVAGWKKITDAVHAAGGRIFVQLWHVGRVSDPLFLNGELPVAPSAIRPNGHVSLVRPFKDYVVPRELNCPEIRGIVGEFKTAAENAKKAGFDGVEIHGANGYLLDQFLQDHSNARTDCWGGSIEHRARLLLEITDACIDIWGAGRVGVHLAPRGDQLDMGDNCPCKTFTYVASELGKRKIAFIFAREYLDEHRLGPRMKEAFGGVYIANERFEKDTAESTIEAGEADAVAFGKLFIANPDLVKRFEVGAGLNEWDAQTFYKGGAKGYIDYPTLEEVGGDGKQVVQDKSEGVAKVQDKIAEKTWPEKIAAQPDPEVLQAPIETRVH